MTSNISHKPSVMSKTLVSAIDGLKIYAEAISDPSKPTIIYIHSMNQPDNDSESFYNNKKQASNFTAVLEKVFINNLFSVTWSYGILIPASYMSVHGCKSICRVVIINSLTGPLYDIHKFFTYKCFPGFTNNTDPAKIYQAYCIFVYTLTY
ncbi:hypothetical protein AN958_12804 [Leucoagaricus sp. SymC.cos]|nr:hypothetical protein AN958_12804 [Leucoagaricus sp. SymC.cos]